MPNGVRIDARRDFVRRVLPWLLAAVMLLLYVLTLNHWVSLKNLGDVASLSGWTWTPQNSGPLFHLVTLPFRLLPATAVPLALNIFSALCAAVALGLLARSVGLLPHDRTEAQQVRERNDFFLLTIRGAWLPPLLAALLCGLQLTFWHSATNGGSDMFDLLLFAFVVWSLVEYRLDGRVWRLYASAAIVGVGMTEGAVMTAFFPLFIVAIFAVRGLAFFRVPFLIRMCLYGLAGFWLLLLYHLGLVLGSGFPVPFWEGVKFSLGAQIGVLHVYWDCVAHPGQYFGELLMPTFISLLPLLVMSVRWKFSDNSKIGSSLTSLMFHAIHAVFLGVCPWIAFDPPFSPREKNLGLPLYYLIALSAGYYAGYFLLVFGTRRPRPNDTPSFVVKLGDTAIVTAVWAVAALALAGLIYKNSPLIRANNANTLRKFASLVIGNLPPKAIVLSDDAERMYLIEAALASDGRAKNYLLLDTAWLPYPQYHRFLHKQLPQTWPLLVKPGQTNILNTVGLIELLAYLSRTNELYYLHPSFGYYFEEFYLEPHGLVYKLKRLPHDTLIPPPPDKKLVALNRSFWNAAQTDALNSVASAVAPPDPDASENFLEAQLDHLHVPHEVDPNCLLVADYCSRSLDFWGVQLQRLGDFAAAAARFRTALELNTNNIAARLNIEVNTNLAAGNRLSANPSSSDAVQQLGTFSNVSRILTQDGPIDDPAFCFLYGYTLAQENKFYRQAVAPLNRAVQLDPDYLPGRIWLARVYGMNHLPDRMFDVLRAPVIHAEESSEADSRQLNMLLSAAYFQKNDLAKGSRLLDLEVSRNPTNQALLAMVGKIYMNRGMFSNALAIANMQLRLSSNDASCLVAKGFLCNQLKKYQQAIITLNRALAIEKDNAGALYQLANAYFGAGNLEAARTNFQRLQEQRRNSPQLAFNLEEVAWRARDTNEAIRNIEIYLAHAPTNTPRAELMARRLRELRR